MLLSKFHFMRRVDFFRASKMMLMAAALAGFACSPSLATTFNAAADFSKTNKPNGVWRYGWASSLGADINLYSNLITVNSTMDLWVDPAIVFANAANVGHNSAPNLNDSHPTVTVPGNQLTFHPGKDGQYSIVRWVAPETGTYSLAATFTGLDHVGPTTTDVHVLHNGISLFDDLINGFGDASAKSFAADRSVLAGDTIDFAVGVGSNGTFWYDTTGLAATISTVNQSVPEPSTALGIVALGAFGAVSMLKRFHFRGLKG